MKHTVEITILLVLIFIAAQVAGLFVISNYIDIYASKETGATVVKEGAYNITGITPPPVTDESSSWIYIMGAVIIGTALVLLIIKFKQTNLWKIWFFASVVITLTVALAPFINRLAMGLFGGGGFVATAVIAAVLTFYKVFRPNIYVHNLTEIFIYGGLAALIVPIMNIFSAVALLIAISIYDMFAVWQSKHMVSMAKYQTESKVFAGLMLSYGKPAETKGKPVEAKSSAKAATAKQIRTSEEKETGRTAILGGGDIAFPLLFAGVIMKTTGGFIAPLIITLFAAIALGLLLLKGQKDKFYPAMPFISAGCFIGWAVTLLL
jgi:presenilin-like A22 family membrane protease